MFGDFRIKTKLLVLLLLPLAVMTAFSGAVTFERYRTAKSVDQLSSMMDVLVTIGGLAHELQKERGMSSGFVGSKGASFGPELAAQRKRGDEAQGHFESALARFEAEHPQAGLGAALAPATSGLRALGELRRKVDGLELAPAALIASYTGLIAASLDGALPMLKRCDDGRLYGQAMAYLALLRGKELAGQERATLNGALSSGAFSKELYKGWISRMAGQDEYLGLFLALADPAVAEAYRARAQPALAPVEGFRKAALESADKPKLEGDPKAWFAASTARIDALLEVETAAARNLAGLGAELLRVARSGLLLSLALWLVASGLSLGVGWLIMRDITATLGRVVEFAGEVASGALDHKLEIARKDELGVLAASLGRMVVALKEQIDAAADEGDPERADVVDLDDLRAGDDPGLPAHGLAHGHAS